MKETMTASQKDHSIYEKHWDSVLCSVKIPAGMQSKELIYCYPPEVNDMSFLPNVIENEFRIELFKRFFNVRKYVSLRCSNDSNIRCIHPLRFDTTKEDGYPVFIEPIEGCGNMSYELPQWRDARYEVGFFIPSTIRIFSSLILNTHGPHGEFEDGVKYCRICVGSPIMDNIPELTDCFYFER